MTDDDFCALYEAHARPLWAYVARVTRAPAAADDIVQEAFLRVHGARSLDDATLDHRRRYLYTVASNLVRKRYRTREEAACDHGWDAPAAGADPAERVAVRDALNALPTIERQALWLSCAERYTSREIAAMLGYREGSLRHVLVRARRRFVECFTRTHAQETTRDD